MSSERLWRLQHRCAPYLFLAPFVLIFCAFMLYPLCRSVVLSFYKAVGPRKLQFVGLDNYRFLLGDVLFWRSVLNTVYFAVLFLTIQIPLALGLSVLLNSRRVIGRSFFRFALFSTHMVGGVFVGVIFGMLLAPR